MRIIGFYLTKILVQKEEPIKGDVQINQNINIKDLTEDSIPISNEKILKIKFNLLINYSNNSKIEFEGNILILPKKEELKKILEQWKTKKIPEFIRVPLFNFIMNKCNVKALYLEDEMDLPLHVPMPRLSFKEPTKSN